MKAATMYLLTQLTGLVTCYGSSRAAEGTVPGPMRTSVVKQDNRPPHNVAFGNPQFIFTLWSTVSWNLQEVSLCFCVR